MHVKTSLKSIKKSYRKFVLLSQNNGSNCIRCHQIKAQCIKTFQNLTDTGFFREQTNIHSNMKIATDCYF